MPKRQRERMHESERGQSAAPAVKRVWMDLEESTRHEVVATLGLLSALALGVSLATHHPGDVGLGGTFASTQKLGLHNWMGWPGAWISELFLAGLGKCAWIVPALVALISLRGFRPMRRPHLGLQALSGVLLLASTCGLLTLVTADAVDTQTSMAWGGLVGAYVGHLSRWFGPLGAYLLLLAGATLGIVFSTNIGPWSMVRMGGRQLGDALKACPRPHLPVRRERDPDWEPEPDLLLPATSLEEELVLRVDGYAPGAIWDDPDDTVIRMDELPDEPPDFDVDGPTPPPETTEAAAVSLDLDGLEITTEMTGILESRQRRKPGKEKKRRQERAGDYELPALDLLALPLTAGAEIFRDEIQQNSLILSQTLREFGMECRVVAVSCGPVVTRYELQPPPGVKISRITSLSDNLALSLKATRVRIIAPIPGKGTVGIEVPNRNRADVLIREVLAGEEYQGGASPLRLALGKTISGRNYVTDLARMPHLLIAGATGTGKSVCVNTIITSILFNAPPEQVKFLMIDPKRVELKLYSSIPHLLYPVITDTRQAGAALEWLVEEMERRYGLLAKAGCRDLSSYNARRKAELSAIQSDALPADADLDLLPGHLPYIVLVIDELADLMTVARAEVETMIIRLAQMARAVGIHLVMATQRPSVNVITGLIKANFPSRIAFRVASKVDSRTILDENGAEALLGLGDMLFTQPGGEGPIRLQGCLITTSEVEKVVEWCKAQQATEYMDVDLSVPEESHAAGEGFDPSQEDDLYSEAVQIVLDNDAASTSLLQRRMKIGYGRAARLLDLMEQEGLIGPPRGSKPREILVGR